MDTFIQHLPYDALAKRTITLEQDNVAMHFKSLTRNFSDEYPYAKINPDFKTVRRGEKEWGGIIYSLIIASIVFVILTKMSQALMLRTIFLSLQITMLILAAILVVIMFSKKDYFYIFDTDGECLLMIRATDKGKAFVKKLREKLGRAV
jgi:hypothetical protein